jgi:hypothetical protein
VRLADRLADFSQYFIQVAGFCANENEIRLYVPQGFDGSVQTRGPRQHFFPARYAQAVCPDAFDMIFPSIDKKNRMSGRA